ncbi:hypothetical protein H6P81_010271 [Aristolochia fimbriata]|uniref:Retrotransposon gag domain-containing protein n=1 Tax=Aristolochia fimbriata TaxID=158543 RepID=A0AAV7EPG0_ARIFI|nr:hypothetical protein H6P81_010271 [Aristolochia fimbriata]
MDLNEEGTLEVLQTGSDPSPLVIANTKREVHLVNAFIPPSSGKLSLAAKEWISGSAHWPVSENSSTSRPSSVKLDLRRFLTRSRVEPSQEIDPEAERTLRQKLKENQNQNSPKDQEDMENVEGTHEEQAPIPRRTMEDYVTQSPNSHRTSIITSTIQANNFDIKPQIIAMLQNHYQFSGLRLFMFTLARRAKTWLNILPASSIVTWEDLQKKFLDKYFPPAKIIKLMNEISQFMQEPKEHLSEAWERFNGLLKRCPNHKIELWSQIEIFYNGLNINTRSMIDAASSGSISKKAPEEVHELIEEMTANMYQYPLERSGKKAAGIYKLDSSTTMQAQLEALQQQFANWQQQSNTVVASICRICGGGHADYECQGKDALPIIDIDVKDLPYPSRAKKDILESRFARFLEIFKKLQINIPLIEALKQMPLYGKFLKEVLSERRKMEEQEEERNEEAIEGGLTHSKEKEDEDPITAREIEELEVENEEELEEEIKEQGAQGASKPELKPLPNNLKYVFLEENDKPVVVFSCLTGSEEKMLIEVLSKHKKAIGWSLSDLEGISPTICMHRVLMEDNYKPNIQPQRMLNPALQEVVKNEVIKLLDTGIIYHISDSAWVSPVEVVPKKWGTTVIHDENNELIPTRMVTCWRVCIDYRKLYTTTRKDNFPLPFIDQMLERKAGNKFYCFLDG